MGPFCGKNTSSSAKGAREQRLTTFGREKRRSGYRTCITAKATALWQELIIIPIHLRVSNGQPDLRLGPTR